MEQNSGITILERLEDQERRTIKVRTNKPDAVVVSDYVRTAIRATGLEPRPYQERVIQKALDMFRGRFVARDGHQQPVYKSVGIESPTGSGKSSMGLLIAKLLQEELKAENRELVIGWVAMRRNLLAQATRENVGKGINVENIHFISMFNSYPEALLRAREEGKLIMMVADESHHEATNSMHHLYNILNPDFVLGMSATPFRTDNQKLHFAGIVKDSGIHVLVQEGFLSPYHHYTISDWKPETVARHYLAEPERWGKSAFYFQDLDRCFQLHRLLQAAGVRSDVITGSSHPDDREEQLLKFEATGPDSTMALINCMVLTEGWDFPALQTAWVRDSSKGPTMQMGGRIFRKHPDVPVKQMVQSKLSSYPFIKTVTPKLSFVWNDAEWLSLEVNPLIDRISMNAIVASIDVTQELPQFLKDRQKRRSRRTWRAP